MILTIIPILGRRAAAGLPRRPGRNRGFFLPAESVAPRKCIAVSFDFHGLRRRFGRSIRAIAPQPFQESMRPGFGGRRGDFFEHRNADMLDPGQSEPIRMERPRQPRPVAPGSASPCRPDPARSVGYRNLPRNREMVLA
jgi:hypothetical protein